MTAESSLRSQLSAPIKVGDDCTKATGLGMNAPSDCTHHTSIHFVIDDCISADYISDDCTIAQIRNGADCGRDGYISDGNMPVKTNQ